MDDPASRPDDAGSQADSDDGDGPGRRDEAQAPPTDLGDEAVDPTIAQRDRAEGQPGPGLEARQGVDPTLVTAWVFVIAGFTPVRVVEQLVGRGYFGPLAWPAILAMVGVLFAAIAIFRSLDLGDRRLRMFAIAALALGMVRLFIVPWF